MNRTLLPGNRTANRIGMALLFIATMATGADTGRPATLRVDSGTVAFDASTNFSAVSVHGKANTLQGRVRLRQDGAKWLIEEVTAKVPVVSLSTGMGLRDEHMRKYIFTTTDGQVPDLQFTGQSQSCPLEPGKETICTVAGKLAVRGLEKPFGLTLKIRPDGAGAALAYRASGEGTVKLSDFGIERPSQFGVKCADEVKIRLEFVGKETQEASFRLGGSQ